MHKEPSRYGQPIRHLGTALKLWRASLDGELVMHRVQALALEMTTQEAERMAEVVLRRSDNTSEGLRWFLLHARRHRDDVPALYRDPPEYQA